MCSFILNKDYAVEIRLNLIDHNHLPYMYLIYTQQKKWLHTKLNFALIGDHKICGELVNIALCDSQTPKPVVP